MNGTKQKGILKRSLEASGYKIEAAAAVTRHGLGKFSLWVKDDNTKLVLFEKDPSRGQLFVMLNEDETTELQEILNVRAKH